MALQITWPIPLSLLHSFPDLCPRLFLFKDTDGSFGISTVEKTDDSAGANTPRIRCPHCAWQPRPSSRWYCSFCPFPEQFLGGCGTAWNTFDTRGVCPGCGHRWRWTSCHRCHRWTLHEEWYEKE